MLIEFSPLQPENASSPIKVTVLGMVIEVSPLQFVKAQFPIEVTELGMMVFGHPAIRVLEDVSMMALQLLRLSYTVLPLGTIIDVSPLQPENIP